MSRRWIEEEFGGPLSPPERPQRRRQPRGPTPAAPEWLRALWWALWCRRCRFADGLCPRHDR